MSESEGEEQRRPSRPKSAMQQAVEEKMFLLDQLHATRHDEDSQQQAAAADDESEEEDDEHEHGDTEPERVEYESYSHCQ